MQTRHDLDRLQRDLVAWGLAGVTPNTRDANLRAIRMMLDGVTFYTFGIRQVERAVAQGMLDEASVVSIMARANGLAGPEAFLGDYGPIEAAAAAGGLLAAARRFAAVVRAKGAIAFGTGHPGSMISFYQHLAAYARGKGATIVHGPVGASVGVDWVLDMVGDVAVTSDGCGVLHGHSTRPMEQLLEGFGDRVDLVVGDHGHAGAGVNAEVPTIAIMDTNDPALAVAAHLGAETLTVVPLYDNRPNAVTARLASGFLELVESP